MLKPEKREATHAHIGTLPCGGVLFMSVDEGRAPAAKDVRETLNMGGTISRVTLEVARASRMCFGCEKDKENNDDGR